MPTIIDKLITVLSFDTDLAKLRKFDAAVRNSRKGIDNISKGAFDAGRQLTVAGGIATGVFGLAAKQAIQWESDFTGVRKTVKDATEEEFAALDKLLRDMAKNDIPLPVGDLAKIAEIGGQLGVSVGSLGKFTKVIAQLGASTDSLTTEDAALQLARFMNIMGTAPAKIENIASAVVELGNSEAATEGDITALALRLATDAKLLGLTEANVLGLAAALPSLGINAEAGGTALSRVFATIGKAIQDGGGKELEAFGKTIGGTGSEFIELFEAQGGNTAFLAFINGLKEMQANGENVNNVLEDLGFTDVRVRRSILSLSNSGELLNRTMSTSAEAWDENIALTREADLRFGTMASRLTLAKNKANDMAITVGGILAPSIVDLITKLEPAVKWLGDFAEKHPTIVKVVAASAAAVFGLGIVLIGVGVAAKIMSFAIAGVAVITKIYTAAVWLNNAGLITLRIQMLATAIATKAATVAQWLLNVAMYANPVGLIILGIIALIATLVAAGYFIYKFRDQILGAFKMAWDWIKANWPLLLSILIGPIGLAVWAIWKYKDQIIGFFQEVWDFITGIDLFGAGAALLESFWQGILSVKDKLIDGVHGIMGEVRDFLPFSDAKRGPLAQLTEAGRSLISTLQSGIQQAGHLDLTSALLPVGPVPPPAAAGGGGATLEITIQPGGIVVQAGGGDTQVIAAGIVDALRQQVRALVEGADTLVEA